MTVLVWRRAVSASSQGASAGAGGAQRAVATAAAELSDASPSDLPPLKWPTFSTSHRPLPTNVGNDDCEVAGGKNGSSRGEPQKLAPRATTESWVDFTKAQARKRRAKEVARLTGLSVKAVENMRMGLSGANAQTLTTWCKNDAAFRAAYFAYCGGESDQGLSSIINDYLQRQRPRH